MMFLYEFQEIFAEHNIAFTYKKYVPGYRDYSKGGQYVEADHGPEQEASGILLPLSNDDLRYDTSGTYSREDMKVFVRFPLTLDKKDIVTVRGKEWEVQGSREYQPEYADFNIYYIRRTDANKEGGMYPS